MKSSRDTSFAKYNHFPKKQSRDPIFNAFLDLLCSVVNLRRYFFRQGSYLYYCRLNLNYLLKGKTRRINLQGSTNFQLAACTSCCTCCTCCTSWAACTSWTSILWCSLSVAELVLKKAMKYGPEWYNRNSTKWFYLYNPQRHAALSFTILNTGKWFTY